MRIFKNIWFTRFARKEGIGDDELRNMVNQLEDGQWDADLGSGVYKKRVAWPGEGKSGGYRAIIFFRSRERTFYHYAYPKSVRGNIDDKELLFFRKLAKRYLSMSENQLKEAVDSGEFIEIQEG